MLSADSILMSTVGWRSWLCNRCQAVNPPLSKWTRQHIQAFSGEEGVMLLLLYTEGGGGMGVTVDSGGMAVFGFGGYMGVTG